MRALDSMRSTRVGWVIAIVFGFVAVPGLADQIVLPTWRLLNIWTVNDVSQSKLIAGGVSLVLIVLVLAIALSVLSIFGRQKR